MILQHSLHVLYILFHTHNIGKQQGKTTPLQNLKVDDLKKELRARGVTDSELSKNKQVLQGILRDELKGIQRVPSLLLLNPSQTLHQVNLTQYTVLVCEPLHDLKGHLANILEELPSILPPHQKQKCLDLLAARLGAKVSGADMRATVIYLYQMLQNEHADQGVLELLYTVIKISKILYLDEEKRTPKQVLCLYNNAWLHMELCKELFSQPNNLTRRKLFGIYLHALSSHAPLQYELVSQKSVNTENQERLFGQARKAAEATSNRHPENVISTVLLRLQAKREVGHTVHSVNEADSQVSKAAASLPEYSRTVVLKSFVRNKTHSWQAHLERISPFLVNEHTWWTESANAYAFKDSDSDSDTQVGGPDILHFCTSTLESVTNRQHTCWKQIADNKVSLPTPSICLYDENGHIEHRAHFTTTTDEETTDDTQANTPHQDSDNSTHEEPTEEDSSCQIPEVEVHVNIIHDEPEELVNETNHDIPQLKTKLAKSLHKAIGMTKELQEFDNIRHKLKALQHDNKPVPQSQVIKHEHQKQTLHRNLEGHTNELKLQLTSYEREHFITRNSLPKTDTDRNYHQLLKKRKYAKWLLSIWETL